MSKPMLKPLITSLMLCCLVAGLSACKTQQSKPQSTSLPNSAPPSNSGSAPSPASQPGSQRGSEQTAGASSGDTPSPTSAGQPGPGNQSPGRVGADNTGADSTGADSAATGPEATSGTPAAQQGHTTDSQPTGKSTTASAGSRDTVTGNTPGQEGPAGSGRSGQSGDSDFSERAGGNSRSREEQLAELEGQLEGSMADYDGMILRERNRAVSQANQRGSEDQLEDFDRSVAYYDEGDGGDGTGNTGGRAAPAPDDPGATGDSQGDQTGGGGPVPGRGRDAPFPPPKDIPDGRNDDVVARQIREAALYEKDPEVREKLWEEYRKYKEATE